MGEYDPIDENASQTKKGWLTAILELGAWLGTLLSGFMAEVLSRKYGVLVACLVFMLGVVIWSFYFAQGLTLSRGSARLIGNVRERAFAAMLRQDMEFYDGEMVTSGALANRKSNTAT